MKLEIPIRKQISLFSMMVAFVLFLTGCQAGEENGTASVRLSFNLSSSKTGAAKTASAPAPSGITSVRIDVTGPGMELLSDSVAVNSGEETVVDLEIPAGLARRFVVTAFDIENTPQFRGEQTVDLVSGSSESIRISMVSLDISVPPGLIEISPRTAFVPKDQTETFSVAGDNPPQVQWQATSAVGNEPEIVGSVDAEGVYTPPATILTDAEAPLFGNPIPVTITATDINNPTVQDSATVHLTTGLNLIFPENTPVTGTPSIFPSFDLSNQRRITFYQGKVYVVWSETRTRGNGWDIFIAESLEGKTWQEIPVVVNRDNQTLEPQPALALGPDGTIYVVYRREVFGDCSICPQTIELVTRRPTDPTFRSQTLVTPPRLTVQEPTVGVAPSGDVFVLWSANIGNSGFDIYLQRIDKDGNPIDASPRNDIIQSINGDQKRPVISIGASGEIFLAWEATDPQTFDRNIFGTASLDNGSNFLKPEIQINGSVDSCCGVSSPTLTAGPLGTVYVAFDTSNCDCSEPSVFFNRGQIISGQLAFENHKQLEFPPLEWETEPSIAWDGIGGIYIAFRGTTANFTDEIFLAKSTDEGNTFNYSQIGDGSSQLNKFFPSLAIDSAGRAFAIWMDGRRGQNEVYDIFFAKGE
jgi:hypothetical protein